MHDKTVRRRRAVLIALVAASLILLTVYFGESAGGGLHSVQRTVLSVFAPIQEGANRALKPFRDFVGWFGDTLDAKSERDDLREERDELRQEVTRLLGQADDNLELRKLVELDTAGGLSAYQPVTSRVIGRSPSVWYSTINIDKGSSAGVRVDQPVVGDGALVGKVTAVAGGVAQVTLITDQGFGAAAKTLRTSGGAGEPGIIVPAVGSPGDLLLDLVENSQDVRKGDRVVTAGTRSSRLASLFPPGILVGEVRQVEDRQGDLQRRIHVTPAADLRRLDFVQVLTSPTARGDNSGAQARVP